MYAIIWLAVLVFLLIAEAVTMGLATIWFAGGALVALIIAMFDLSVWLQIGSFIVVSAILLIFTRPIALRYMNQSTIKTNVDALVGKQGIVQETINNLQGTGKVKINDVFWTARAEDDDTIIEKDKIVEIVQVEGVKLLVKERGE